MLDFILIILCLIGAIITSPIIKNYCAKEHGLFKIDYTYDKDLFDEETR